MSLSLVPWQVLIVVGATLTSVGQIFNKYQVHRAASFQVTIYKYIAGSILMTGFWLATNGILPKYWWALVIYGMTTGFSVVLYTKASRFSLSKSVLTNPMSQVIAIGLASVVFEEWRLFSLQTMAGRQMLLALLLVPVVLGLFYEKNKQNRQWSFLIWTVIIWLALVRVFQKFLLINIEPIQLLMLQYWGSLLVSIIGSKIRGHKLYVDKRFSLVGLIHGLITSTAILLYFSGLKQVSVSQAVLLRMPIILIMTACFGLFIFKEIKEMTVKKWLGFVLSLSIALLVITANH